MAVLLNRPYMGYAAGSVVQLQTATESALIAQGIATASAATPTSGAYTTSQTSGRCAIAAAASSITITNPNVTTESKITAVINQAAADGTLLYIARIVPANGSFTIYGNAAATAATVVDWTILMPSGELPTP